MLDIFRRPPRPGAIDMHDDNVQRGFSLVETMVTLALAAIGVTLAVPAMQTLLADGQRVASGNALVATMHAARSAAITRNVQVTVCPSHDGKRCDNADWGDGWIWFTDPDQDRRVGPTEQILGVGAGLGDVTIRSADFERFFVFRPDGQIMAKTIAQNSGEMLLCDPRGPQFSRKLILHVGGKPELVTDKPAAYTGCSRA